MKAIETHNPADTQNSTYKMFFGLLSLVFCAAVVALAVTVSFAASDVCTQSDSGNSYDLKKELEERSKKYLQSIEKNPNLSPETKQRLKTQAENVVATGMKKLASLQTDKYREPEPKNKNEDINLTMFVNAVKKINNDESSIKTLKFLSRHHNRNSKIYKPTQLDIAMKVALPNYSERINNSRITKYDPRKLFGNFGIFDSNNYSGIITTNNTRSQKPNESKSQIQTTTQTQTNALKNVSSHSVNPEHIYSPSVLIARIIVLRN
ncbi:MAG: hypothetical protein LBQ66_06070 [Planctomycetaceae bacterium]|jgi:hypothetical protein|nr:hypothetical protein [Planctomycetaceae bacterium]